MAKIVKAFSRCGPLMGCYSSKVAQQPLEANKRPSRKDNDSKGTKLEADAEESRAALPVANPKGCFEAVCMRKADAGACRAAEKIEEVEGETIKDESGLVMRTPRRSNERDLFFAARTGDLQLVYYLLDISCDDAATVVNADSPSMHNTLHSYKTGSTALLVDVNERGMWGNTPLLVATQYGHANVALVLLKYGADARAENERQATALHYSCADGGIDVCRAIFDNDADADPPAAVVHHPCVDGGRTLLLTPLSAAAVGGYVEIVRLLLQHGAEVNRRVPAEMPCKKNARVSICAVDEGMSPLMEAAKHGRTDTCILLIDNGAELVAKDCDGRTAFIHAILGGHERTAHALLMVATAKLTGRARCLPEAVGLSSHWGQKLLQLACDKGLHFAVESLLSAGADIDARDSSGATSLLHACRKGCVLCARKLFSRGADPLAADNNGETPVMTARNRRHDHADGGVILELLVTPVTALERSAPGPCADPKLPAETNRADWGEGNNTNIASNKDPDEDENEDIILVSDWNNDQELDSSDIWDGNKDSIAPNAASNCDALANKFRSSEDIGSADITTMEAGGEQDVLLCEDFESEAVENGSPHYLPTNGETEEGTTFESTCCIIEKDNEDLLLVGDHGSGLVGERGSLDLTRSGMENETSEKAMGGGDVSIKAAPTPPTGTRGIDGKEGEVRGTVPETENAPESTIMAGDKEARPMEMKTFIALFTTNGMEIIALDIYSETLECRPRGDSLASAVRVSYSPQLELHSNEKEPVGSGDSKGTTAGICSSHESYEVAANFVNDLVPEAIVSTTTPPNELRDSTTKRYEYENE